MPRKVDSPRDCRKCGKHYKQTSNCMKHEKKCNGNNDQEDDKKTEIEPNPIPIHNVISNDNRQQQQNIAVSFEINNNVSADPKNGQRIINNLTSPDLRGVLNAVVNSLKDLRKYPDMYDYEFVDWRAKVIIDLHQRVYCNEEIPQNQAIKVTRKSRRSGVRYIHLQYFKGNKWLTVEEVYHQEFFSNLHDLLEEVLLYCIKVTEGTHNKTNTYEQQLEFAQLHQEKKMNVVKDEICKTLRANLLDDQCPSKQFARDVKWIKVENENLEPNLNDEKKKILQWEKELISYDSHPFTPKQSIANSAEEIHLLH